MTVRPPAIVLILAVAFVAGGGSAEPIPAAPQTRAPARLDMAAVAGMDREIFVASFGGIFEHSPWVAERAWERRPFASLDALHRAMMAAVRDADPREILALLNAHPELAGPEARARRMTTASVSEQDSAGLDRMSDAEFDRFDRLNAAYRLRFGFPFIIAVRGRDRVTIVSEFERRLAHAPDAEIEAALAEVSAITRMRLSLKVAATP